MKKNMQQLFSVVFKTLLLLNLVFTINLAAMAGGKLVGKVTDSNTGEPLIGVNVVVEDLTLGAATDIEGDYLILNIPPGLYSVKASMIGYKTLIQTNVEISINHTTYLNFQLEETVMELDESVVITAERPLVEKDLTSTRHYVSATEISARPTDQLTNILTTLPGIDISPGGELVVRRGSLDQVSFLIDGIRARNPLDFQPYTNINLSAIQELEIITGGFNAEYGEAQSGVFNIVTKEGGREFEGYAEFKYTPPGLKHWGTALYDYSSPIFWENSHARHQQWWIDNPNQWVDPNGVYGNDPNCIWTPEMAYEDYMSTHQPLTDYTDLAGYQTEVSFGGPTPVDDLFFFFTGKFKTAPPLTGNSFLRRGNWYDGTLKLTYQISKSIKLMVSGFYSSSKSAYGTEWFTFDNGFDNKYALYDFWGYPRNSINSQSIKMTHVLSPSTFYELQFTRFYRYRSQDTFPGDEDLWESAGPVKDNLRAREDGVTIPDAYNNFIGMHTTGYYYRGVDKNTDWSISGDFTSQILKQWQLEAGFDFTYYNLDRFQEAKAYQNIEREIYNPYEGNIFVQSKVEFEGLIMNLGLRLDFYNPNQFVYNNPFDPFDFITAYSENRDADPNIDDTQITGQLSPRIGISHPISDKTVLHFSYGHFFQRAPFGDYGEGSGTGSEGQTVTGLLNTYVVFNEDSTAYTPYNLGNRKLKPRKTVSYELGVEHNLGGIVTKVTAFYKDYTNDIRTVRVFMDDGSSYLTTGNSDYSDSKGIEISIRKPFSGLWGGYLNYSWSTGITGRSGDPDVIASPLSGFKTRTTDYTGDYINYDRPRLKFGLVFSVPDDFDFLWSIFDNLQISLDYQVYYPHEQLVDDNYAFGSKSFIKEPMKNARIGIRKEFKVSDFNLAFFIEMQNAFNDRHVNVHMVNSSTASTTDQVKYVNSNFAVYPTKTPSGGPFPDAVKYNNLPRSVVFGLALGF